MPVEFITGEDSGEGAFSNASGARKKRWRFWDIFKKAPTVEASALVVPALYASFQPSEQQAYQQRFNSLVNEAVRYNHGKPLTAEQARELAEKTGRLVASRLYPSREHNYNHMGYDPALANMQAPVLVPVVSVAAPIGADEINQALSAFGASELASYKSYLERLYKQYMDLHAGQAIPIDAGQQMQSQAIQAIRSSSRHYHGRR